MHFNLFPIHPDDIVQTVQERFTRLFPTMQISFFRDTEFLKKTDQSILLGPKTRLNEINPAMNDTAIEIRAGMKVSDLEKILKSLGFHAQISCRIRDRRLPEFSVISWLLQDVYEKESIPSLNTLNKKTIIPLKLDSIT